MRAPRQETLSEWLFHFIPTIVSINTTTKYLNRDSEERVVENSLYINTYIDSDSNNLPDVVAELEAAGNFSNYITQSGSDALHEDYLNLSYVKFMGVLCLINTPLFFAASLYAGFQAENFNQQLFHYVATLASCAFAMVGRCAIFDLNYYHHIALPKGYLSKLAAALKAEKADDLQQQEKTLVFFQFTAEFEHDQGSIQSLKKERNITLGASLLFMFAGLYNSELPANNYASVLANGFMLIIGLLLAQFGVTKHLSQSYMQEGKYSYRFAYAADPNAVVADEEIIDTASVSVSESELGV